jgi:hypothetical protein
MKLKNLEIHLQKVQGFKNPVAGLEQYMTPAPLAARFLFDAFLHGDIEGMKVLDLGCGTGMLSVGAALLGGRRDSGCFLSGCSLFLRIGSCSIALSGDFQNILGGTLALLVKFTLIHGFPPDYSAVWTSQ